MKKLLLAAIAALLGLGCSTAHHAVGMPSGLTETLNIGATIRSTPFDATQTEVISYAVRSTGTSAGSWALMYSNDYVIGVDDPTSDAKWDVYNPAGWVTPPAASGSGQTFGVTAGFYEFKWARLRYTYTSGAGSALVAVRAK